MIPRLTDHGVSRDDASYYNDHVNKGGVFVSVDLNKAGIAADTATDILYRHGGHSSSRVRNATTI